MRFILLMFSIFLSSQSPVYAEDIFNYFTHGAWGSKQSKFASCESNPVKISFSDDKTRAYFTMPKAGKDYRGQSHKSYGYDVISFDKDGIVMRLDDEQRLTPDGKIVIWVLKSLPDHMFCWGRTDWPSTGCLIIHVRCPELPPIS